MIITKKSNLMAASNQWLTRPPDERFWTIDEMIEKCKLIDKSRAVTVTALDSLSTTWNEKDGLRLIGKDKDMSVGLTNWGFTQLATRLKAPPAYLRTLPGKLVTELLNHSIKTMEEDEKEVRISVRTEEKLPMVECFTSDRYCYIPNFKIAEGLKVLEKSGWRTAPARPCGNKDPRARAATKADVLGGNKGAGNGLAIKVGDMIAPAGLYAGDKNMFAFLIHEGHLIDDGSGKHGLNRGVFVRNSEVGDGAFKITTFLYDYVCGNHIVWGASEVKTLAIRHLGKAEPKVFSAMEKDLTEYIEADASAITKKISAARKLILGKDKLEVMDAVFSNRKVGLALQDVGQAYDLCEEFDHARIKPNTLWGVVTGITRLSQKTSHASHRTTMDSACEALMEMAV